MMTVALAPLFFVTVVFILLLAMTMRMLVAMVITSMTVPMAITTVIVSVIMVPSMTVLVIDIDMIRRDLSVAPVTLNQTSRCSKK